MPLGRNISANFTELYKSNKEKPVSKRRSRKQIIAIALSAAGKLPKRK